MIIFIGCQELTGTGIKKINSVLPSHGDHSGNTVWGDFYPFKSKVEFINWDVSFIVQFIHEDFILNHIGIRNEELGLEL